MKGAHLTVGVSVFEGLFRQAPDAILLVSGAGRLVEANPKALTLLGFSREELLGRELSTLVPEQTREEFRRAFVELAGGGEICIELDFATREGGALPVELRARKMEGHEDVYVGIFRDVSARKQMESEFRRRNRELFVLHSIASVVNQSLDLHEILESGLEKVLTLLNIEGGYVVLLNERTGELELAAHRGLSREFVREYSRRPLRVGEGITGQVFITGEPVLSEDASNDVRVTRPVVRRDRLGSSLNVPIKSKERILGVLMVVGLGIRKFSSWDIEVLTTIGNEIGVSLENSRLYRDVVELLRFSSELNRKVDTDGILRFLARKARELVPCEVAAAALTEPGVAFGYLAEREGCRSFRREMERGRSNGFLTSVADGRERRLRFRLVDGTGAPLGFLELAGRKGLAEFTQKDRDLVSALAAQASIALEKSRLFKEREREARFVANVVENMASGLMVVDAKGSVQKVNRRTADMIGLGEEEVCGTPVSRWLPESQAVLGARQFPFSLETELRSCGGDPRAVKLIASAHRNDSLGLAGVILIIQDLAQIRDLEKKERERRRLATIGEVAAGVAHEIRNPLFGISSVAQILRMEPSGRPEHRPLLDAMMSEIERMNRMVEDLLLYGRPSALVADRVDVAQIWHSIVMLHDLEIQKRRLTVELDFPAELGSLSADESKLRQVFLNLLKNAFDATPPGGKIRVQARRRESPSGQDGLEIAVQDTGKGIAPDKIGKIFDLFYSEKRGGAGMGLPICKKIVEDHGGSIEVASQPGKTTFRVWLPKVAASFEWGASNGKDDRKV